MHTHCAWKYNIYKCPKKSRHDIPIFQTMKMMLSIFYICFNTLLKLKMPASTLVANQLRKQHKVCFIIPKFSKTKTKAKCINGVQTNDASGFSSSQIFTQLNYIFYPIKRDISFQKQFIQIPLRNNSKGLNVSFHMKRSAVVFK